MNKEDLDFELKMAGQRAEHPLGIDDRARWNLNNHITKVAAELIEWLRDNKNGIPVGISNMQEDNYEQQEKEWDDILNKIHFSFISLHKISNDEAYLETSDLTQNDKDNYKEFNIEAIPEEPVMEGLKLFVTWIKNLWD